VISLFEAGLLLLWAGARPFEIVSRRRLLLAAELTKATKSDGQL